MVVSEGVGFVVLFGQFPEVAVDIVGITALCFELNRHMFYAEVGSDPVLDELQKLKRSAMVFDHDMAGQHNQTRFHCPDVKIVHILHAGDGLNRCCDVRDTDARRSRFQ